MTLRHEWGRHDLLPLLMLLIGLVACNFPGIGEQNSSTTVYVTATTLPHSTTAPSDQPTATASQALPTAIATIAYTPVFEVSDCQFLIPLGYSPECGFLVVPENRADPKTEMIRLHVAIFRSVRPQPDPIIQLAGGPGSGATGLINYHFSTGIGRLLESRDLIFFDQRGTGESQPFLGCPEREAISADLLSGSLRVEQQFEVERQAFLTCRDRLTAQGVDLSAYNSAASAADVNDLRIALGYNQINLYGVSYGTRLALTIMRDYPDILRSVILDSVYPPEQNLYTELTSNTERAINTMISACNSQPGCAESYPDLQTVFYETVDALNANPAQVAVTHPNSGQTVNVLLTGDLFVDLVPTALYNPAAMIYVPQMIYNVHSGYYSPFLQQRLTLYLDGSASRGMTVSVQCNEEIPFSTYEELQAESASAPPQIAHNYVQLLRMLYALCDDWGAGKANPVENQPVHSSIPALVLAGSFDPITPPEWSHTVAETLDNAYYFEFPVGHWTMRASPCPIEIAASFLNTPGAAPDSGCVANVPQPEFVR